MRVFAHCLLKPPAWKVCSAGRILGCTFALRRLCFRQHIALRASPWLFSSPPLKKNTGGGGVPRKGRSVLFLVFSHPHLAQIRSRKTLEKPRFGFLTHQKTGLKVYVGVPLKLIVCNYSGLAILPCAKNRLPRQRDTGPPRFNLFKKQGLMYISGLHLTCSLCHYSGY